MFVRVRGATPGDPLHEFHIPESLLQRHPDRYKVVDPKPVAKALPASSVPGAVPARKQSAPKPRKAAPKPGENNAPSVGPTEEETA